MFSSALNKQRTFCRRFRNKTVASESNGGFFFRRNVYSKYLHSLSCSTNIYGAHYVSGLELGSGDQAVNTASMAFAP